MDNTDLQKKLPGLLIERHRNGSLRYRVRKDGQPGHRVSIDISPKHPRFIDAYFAARAGVATSFANDYVSVVAATGNLNAHIRGMIAGARERSRLAGVECSITKANILAMIDRQKGKCALSGVPFSLERGETRRRPFAPSLDRIVPAASYTPDNVRITSVIANLSRSNWGDEILAQMAAGITGNVSRTDNLRDTKRKNLGKFTPI